WWPGGRGRSPDQAMSCGAPGGVFAAAVDDVPVDAAAAEVGGGGGQARPGAPGAAGGDHVGVVEPAAGPPGDDRDDVVLLPQVVISVVQQPGLGERGGLCAGTGSAGEVAGVGEDVGGDPGQSRFTAPPLSLRAEVGGQPQVSPPGFAVAGPVDVCGDRDLGRDSAAGEVGDVVAGAERLDGEGTVAAVAVHAQYCGQLVGEPVGGFHDDDRAPCVQQPGCFDGGFGELEGVPALVVAAGLGSAVGPDHHPVLPGRGSERRDACVDGVAVLAGGEQDPVQDREPEAAELAHRRPLRIPVTGCGQLVWRASRRAAW